MKFLNLLTLLALPVTYSSTAYAEPSTDFSVSDYYVSGSSSGCELNGAAIHDGSDTVNFKVMNFSLDTNSDEGQVLSDGLRHLNSSCRFFVKMKVPENHRIALESVTYRGTFKVPKGRVGAHVEHWFDGQFVENFRYFWNSEDGIFNTFDEERPFLTEDGDPLWSKCGHSEVEASFTVGGFSVGTVEEGSVFELNKVILNLGEFGIRIERC